MGVSVRRLGNRLNWVSSSMRWRLAFKVSNMICLLGNEVVLPFLFGVIFRLRCLQARTERMILAIGMGRVERPPVL